MVKGKGDGVYEMGLDFRSVDAFLLCCDAVLYASFSFFLRLVVCLLLLRLGEVVALLLKGNGRKAIFIWAYATGGRTTWRRPGCCALASLRRNE